MMNRKTDLTADLLVEKLAMRLPTATVVKAYDASGDAYVTVVVGSGNNSVEAIAKFVPGPSSAAGQYDALGLAQRVYSPHIAQLLFDSNVAGTPGGSLGGTAWTVKTAVYGEVMRNGMRVDVYVKDAGAGNLAVTDIAVGNFSSTFNSLEWGSLASV
jgi:hypothetical protein